MSTLSEALLKAPSDSNVIKEHEITKKIIEKRRKQYKESMIKPLRTTSFESQIVMIRDTKKAEPTAKTEKKDIQSSFQKAMVVEDIDENEPAPKEKK